MFKKKQGDINSRRAILWMHPEALLHFMTSKRWVITEGYLPADVQFISWQFMPERAVFMLILQSKEFKPLMLGEQMPELPPIKFKWYNGEGEVK